MSSPEQTSQAQSQFKKIRRIILSRVLLAPFIILMIVCSTLVYYFATSLFERVESELMRVADDHRNLIEQFFAERTQDLQFIAGSQNFDSISRQKQLADIFQALQSISPAFLDLGVFDQYGTHVAYAGPYALEGKNYKQTEWFKAVEEKAVYISDVFLGYRNTPHFIIAVKKMTGAAPWYLRATIDTFFFNNLVENVRVGKTGEAFLINKNGVFQTKKRSGGKLMETDPDFSGYQQTNGRIVSYTARDRSGDKYHYAVGRLEQNGWLMVVRQDFTEAATPLIKAVLVAMGLVFSGGAGVVLIAYILASGLALRLSMAAAEKREMSSQLIMAGKLAEVGEMSSGIAHEINNPLQVMKAEVTLIDDLFYDLKTEDEQSKKILKMLRESMSQINLQIDRCRNITQGLLKFARKSEPVSRKISPRDLIQETVDMISHQASLDGITIRHDEVRALPEIESDFAQLQQVFLNLLNNAIYAVKDSKNPEIKISYSMDKASVMICVEDNGCGIAPDQLEKIFMPFFTTKPVGKGTGLGLSTCFGIIENLGGRIEVASREGSGTTFTVYLPISGSAEKNKDNAN